MHQLYMAKLGVQVEQKQLEQQQGKPTRTQRVKYKQALERQEIERIRFENLKAEAKRIQEEKFKDRVNTIQQTYNIYRPKKYSARSWARMSARNKANIMKQYQRGRGEGYYFSKGLLVVDRTATRDVQKVVPFTLEDVEGTKDNSYKDVYDILSPDLKQFFYTPEVVLENKATSIKTTKQTILDKQAETDKKIAEVKQKYADKIAKSEASFRSKSSSYRERNRDRQRERIRDYKDDLDEAVKELRGYKEGLSKGFTQLNQNKDVDFNLINDYAWDVANYYERKEEARNKNKKNYRDQVAKGELDEDFEKLGFDKAPSYYKFNQSVKDFNKDVAYKNNLLAWSNKVGFDKISPHAQKVLNPELAEWYSKNPTEKLIFNDAGEIAGVERI